MRLFNKRMRQKTAAILLLIMILAAVSGCKSSGQEETVVDVVPIETEAPTERATDEPVPVTTPEPTSGTFELARPGFDGFVLTNSTGAFGIAKDGTLRFIGNAVSGQNYAARWKNIVCAAVNDRVTAGLDRCGTLYISCPEDENIFAGAEEWTDLVWIAMGDAHIAGLRADGTVVSAGEASEGRLDTGEWERVSKISAAGNYTAALTDGGVLTTAGMELKGALDGAAVKDISAAKDLLAVLFEDGTVRAYSPEGEEKQYPWTGIVRIFAGEGAVYAVNGRGELFTDSELIPEGVNDVWCVAAAKDHAIVLHGDGSCEGFGENGELQTEVSGWRLLPYLDDEGWLLGLAEGSEMDGRVVYTGMKCTYTEPATGETSEATAVVLGDVNGDTYIDEYDAEAVRAHISGEAKLEGAYLRAANVIKDGRAPSSIDVNDLDRIDREAACRGLVDQYAKTDKYTGTVAELRRVNPDVHGYVDIPDTNIKYPLLYGKNWFYHDHDERKQESSRGSIYTYWPSDTGNIVITGHNMRVSGTMFHQLHTVQDRKARLNEYANRVWYLSAFGESGYWEVWALYEEGAFKSEWDSSLFYNTNWPNVFDSFTEEEKQAWIDYQLERTELGFTPYVTTEDRFMTLVTCGDTHAASNYGSRLYVFLRWVGSN